MSDKGFTDDEVRDAINEAANTTRPQGSGLYALEWAASEYLKAKAVIEWYGDEKNWIPKIVECTNAEFKARSICDEGAKAREYLEKLNQNKGE